MDKPTGEGRPMEGRPSTADVDTLEAEIIGSLPRSVDDPAWESPTAARVRDLAARAREQEADENFVRAEALQAELGSMEDRAEAVEADRDRLLSDLASVRLECDRFDAEAERLGLLAAKWKTEADRLARRVAELKAALREIAELYEIGPAAQISRAALAGDGGGATADKKPRCSRCDAEISHDGLRCGCYEAGDGGGAEVAFIENLSAQEAAYWEARRQGMGLTDKQIGDLLRAAAKVGDGGGARRSTNQSFMGSVNTTDWNRDSGNPPTAGDRDGA